MQDFHNTIHLQGNLFEQHNTKAKKLSELVLECFRNEKTKEFTPCEIWVKLGKSNHLLTSVRRAISNLTADKVLRKTNNKKMGMYKTPNYTWTYNN